MEKLTKKQQAFVDHYVASLNATQAYMRAYGTDNENTAGVNGHKLLKNTKVVEAIDARLAEVQNKRIATAEEVLEFLTSVIYSSDAKMQDRIRSAELLGKRHKLFTDKMEVDASVDVEVNLVGLDEDE